MCNGQTLTDREECLKTLTRLKADPGTENTANGGSFSEGQSVLQPLNIITQGQHSAIRESRIINLCIQHC